MIAHSKWFAILTPSNIVFYFAGCVSIAKQITYVIFKLLAIVGRPIRWQCFLSEHF